MAAAAAVVEAQLNYARRTTIDLWPTGARNEVALSLAAEWQTKWPQVTHRYYFKHLAARDVSVAVEVVHVEGPLELLLELAA